jgi:hypothetical protein
MFEDTTLVVVGDSFVYGHLGDDVDVESCHNRSWVRQLEKIGNFKTSVNLGAPGGSNYRSVRVVHEYLDQHYNPNEKYLLIFAASEFSRFELPVNDHVGRIYGITIDKPPCYSTIQNETVAAILGPWHLNSNDMEKRCELGEFSDFLSMYYASFTDDAYSEKLLRNSLFSLKAVLDKLNIKSFFTSTILPPEILDGISFLGEKLPLIKYFYEPDSHDNIGRFLKLAGYKRYPCAHYDEHAYKFLANYIYKNYLMDEQNDIQRS